MTFKKINTKETLFHYIEIDATNCVLFDSELNQPIIYGSKNRVAAVIKNLPTTIRINYYTTNEDYIKIGKIYEKRKGH
jgi:hypothetical protein